MKRYISLLLLISLLTTSVASAQANKEEREEKKEEIRSRIKDKTDYTIFHRQMLSLKEYSEERRKIPSLQKANKTIVKVIAIVDSADDDSKIKNLTGYIVQNIGDNTTNVYEVTFDRGQKKIIAVKHTTEAVEADRSEKEEQTQEPKTKKAIHKKAKDEDDAEDDDKPAKTKDKDDE